MEGKSKTLRLIAAFKINQKAKTTRKNRKLKMTLQVASRKLKMTDQFYISHMTIGRVSVY